MKSLQIHPYSLLLIVLLTVSGIQSDAQKLPELFYFQFDDTGRLMRNLADASTALSPFATLNSPLGEASGQFGSALRGVNQTAGTANCNTNVALQHTGGWTISMWVNGVGQSRSVS